MEHLFKNWYKEIWGTEPSMIGRELNWMMMAYEAGYNKALTKPKPPEIQRLKENKDPRTLERKL